MCLCLYVYVCVHGCIPVCARMYVFVCLCVCVCARLYVCLNLRVTLCVHSVCVDDSACESRVT